MAAPDLPDTPPLPQPTSSASDAVDAAPSARDATTRPPMLPSLPLDVLLVVMDNLACNDLVEAMLVSRAWAARARPALFANLYLWGSLHTRGVLFWHAIIVGNGQDYLLSRLDYDGSPLALIKTVVFHRVRPDVATRVARLLASVGARPHRVFIFLSDQPTAELAAALVPLLSHCTHFSFKAPEFTPSNVTCHFESARKLTSLRWLHQGSVIPKQLLLENRQTLRTLDVTLMRPEVVQAVQEFFAAGTSLRKLNLSDGELGRGSTIVKSFQDGSLKTLRALALVIDGTVEDLEHLQGEDFIPPITTLKLEFFAHEHIRLLARVAQSVQSLSMTLPKRSFQPHEALGLALDWAGIPKFTALLDLRIQCDTTITLEHLEEIVNYCPNLETLSVLTIVENITPIRKLHRLRHLNLIISHDFGAVDVLSDLVKPPVWDSEPTAASPRVRLYFSSPREIRPQADSAGKKIHDVSHSVEEAVRIRSIEEAVRMIEDQSSGRLRIVSGTDGFPTYF
ncbi:hypothetical protein HK405_008091 [Cladochytrium tenue]|nr:hypothetical protein HK405_008091 [Cladochytrium tenue]